MAAGWTPPAKGTQLFVVLRYDRYVDDVTQSIVGTRAFLTRESAQTDAARLNALNADKESRYFVVVARLQSDEDSKASPYLASLVSRSA
jgi:hypothetical protein